MNFKKNILDFRKTQILCQNIGNANEASTSKLISFLQNQFGNYVVKDHCQKEAEEQLVKIFPGKVLLSFEKCICLRNLRILISKYNFRQFCCQTNGRNATSRSI